MTTTSTRGEDAKLREMMAALADTVEGDVLSWLAFSPAHLRSILSELLELREAVAAYSRERTENVSRLLRSLSQGAGHEQ